MNKGNYALEVLVNGRSVREYKQDGYTFIEGRSNTQYSLRIRNNSWKRVLALVSVDGLGVISGKPATHDDAGYIIAPWSAIEIKGFRESDLTVGSFLFTNRDASYAAGQGVPLNAGVIGVRLIDEKEKPVFKGHFHDSLNPVTWGTGVMYPVMSGMMAQPDAPRPAARRRIVAQSEATYCSSLSPAPTAQTFDLGTTWGKRVQDRVTTVDFERGAFLDQLDLYYASRGSLEALGIRFVEETPIAFPKAFPTYAKPPANWQG